MEAEAFLNMVATVVSRPFVERAISMVDAGD
jgi:hypothetical protein